ncbi:hypothetical protein CA946_13510 [Fischerella thermalis 111/344/542]|nr:hypothetical protein CA946_13510 [Fischerella thermalis 111/344/542]
MFFVEILILLRSHFYQLFRLDKGFIWLKLIFALAIAAILLWIDIELGIESVPAIQEFGLFRFLSESNWNPVTNVYSVLPQVYGTLVSDFIDLLVAKKYTLFPLISTSIIKS